MQQLREAVAAKPDGIAMMGHPGDAAIMPLAEQASKDGIKMMYQNVPVPEVVAAFGGGYVGAQPEPQGRALGDEAVQATRASRPGDTAIVIGAVRQREPRRARARHGRRRSKEAGVNVVSDQLAAGMGRRSEPRDPGHHRGDPQQSRTSR